MGIRIIRKGKTYRRWWYGEYRDGGKLCRIKLGVKVTGRPPESFSCKDVGDSAFEVSKAKAQSAFDEFMESRQQKVALSTFSLDDERDSINSPYV